MAAIRFILLPAAGYTNVWLIKGNRTSSDKQDTFKFPLGNKWTICIMCGLFDSPPINFDNMFAYYTTWMSVKCPIVPHKANVHPGVHLLKRC